MNNYEIKGEIFTFFAALFLALNTILGRYFALQIAPLLPWFSRNVINFLILLTLLKLYKPKGYIKINKNDLAKIFLSGIFFTFSKELANFFENLMEMEKEIQIVLSARFI
ncbi:hypothetical protein A3F07_03890 [candidate division WWE3 bacterium RIFCSPHIGHO2_12_FULL_38_15]|uniref:EamA domain-containing protein n=1 Tax=candidate division WWE3 bacterium RIFCSPHIGHO2_02_FULL_38_14 TaxID=1802620 RepID=A0A1F4V7U6_UNCKA|nr:MAG: hypothetical protein A3F07_03890 [candidate division WWE3 bacterium RIFCSPHIGHO2_12_FULL_38_15]OGC53259.1 MAG: hypothetical protein A3D91_02485 [candidate division WWE3 bacterium RIFCSPHIGHO2_02_FULL_38_14]